VWPRKEKKLFNLDKQGIAQKKEKKKKKKERG
jgi:hypothetical protein